jgi:hypothetical protein
MKLLTRTGLIAAAAVAGLLTATANPTSACSMFKGTTPDFTISFDGPSDWLSKTPDAKSMGIALGGFSAIAAALTGGFMFYRKQHLAKLAELSVAAVAEEMNTSTAADQVVSPDQETAHLEVTPAEAQAETKDLLVAR